MLHHPDALITDFVHVATLAHASISERHIVHVCLSAPHIPKPLPAGMQAVYVFSLTRPPYMVLKVGKAGSKSNARFQSQHYLPASSKSNLAKSLLNRSAMWPHLGIAALADQDVGPWLRAHTDRDHFFIAAEHGPFILALLEAFLQCRLRPTFEG
jgi:hypothetical protein